MSDKRPPNPGRKAPWKAKGASGGARAAGAADLFAWAANQPAADARDTTASRSAKPSNTKTKAPKRPAQARRGKSADTIYDAPKRSYYARGLGSLVPKLTRKAIGARASLDADLQIYWREVVGDSFAEMTYPRKSRFDHAAARVGGVLELGVERGCGAMVAHAKGELLEKLNAYLGLGTFRDVKLKEGPLPKRAVPGAGGGGPNRQGARTVMQIDLSDPATRTALGLPRRLDDAPPPSAPSAEPWMPPPPRRHRLALAMDDSQGGSGVAHKPLAQALTYLGASLASRRD